jgi:hypothetical protein
MESHTSKSIRCHLHIHSPLSRGLRRRRERQPILQTSRPATLAQRVRGAEGGSTRVALLQLHLSTRAPTQGIFQYNNVLGLPSQDITTTYRRSLHSILTLENQQASPGRGNTDVRQYFYDVYVKSAESRSVQTSHRVNQPYLRLYKILQGST